MSLLTEAQRAQLDKAIAATAKQNGTTGPRSRTSSVDAAIDDEDEQENGKMQPLWSGKKCVAKKGGGGGKGTWGALLDVSETPAALDRGDPNYDSSDASDDSSPYAVSSGGAGFRSRVTDAVVEYKEKVKHIIEEYFVTGEVPEATQRLQDLNLPLYEHFIVKRAVTMALDRQSRELELTARLLSGAYGKAISQQEMIKGFRQLVTSADDIRIDVPEAASVLGVFVARAIVDDILPPAFVKQAKGSLSDNRSVAYEALKHCESQLSGRHAAERLLQFWSNSVVLTVEDAKTKIKHLLAEYLESSRDIQEAISCVRDLKMPFFNHEIVKKALTMAIEKSCDQEILALLKALGKSRDISANQMAVGFGRMAEAVEDLSLDVPTAAPHFEKLTKSAIESDILEAALYETALRNQQHISSRAEDEVDDLTLFKRKATNIIREYFSAGDVAEVNTSLAELQDIVGTGDLYLHHFVKRLVIYSLDFKDREREKAAVLLSMLYPFPLTREAIEHGLKAVMEASEDLTLDVPDAPGLVALFLARAVVDDLLAPSFLNTMASEFDGLMGSEIARAAQVLLSTRHAAARVLRVWGGDEGGTVQHTKEKMVQLLQEYSTSQDLMEASRCLHSLHVPFYHHELVKKALTMAIEQPESKNGVLMLLTTLCKSGQVSMTQMAWGFDRMQDVVEDLSLDVPGAGDKLKELDTQARELSILSSAPQEAAAPPKGPSPMSYAKILKSSQ